MSCSPKSTPKPSDEKAAPLAGGGGATSLPGRFDLSDWVELMDVVEALCPVWPPPPARTCAAIYKL